MNIESFFIGLFCGAYGMFTLMGLLWCGSKETPKHSITVDTDGIEQD